MIRPNRQSGLMVSRRLLCLAVAVAFTLTVFPIPLPVSAPIRTQKDTSEPFPCQNRPCGCSSADQCWKKCCCFTNQQKVTWAKKNDVSIPLFVVDAAKDEARLNSQMDLAELSDEQLETEICSLPEHVHTQHTPPQEPLSEMQRGTKNSPEDSSSTTPGKVARGIVGWMAGFLNLSKQHSVDELIAKLDTQVTQVTKGIREYLTTTTDPDPESFSDIQLVLIIKAMECRGQGSQWVVCAPVTMQFSVCLKTVPDACIEFVQDYSERLERGSLQPPVPPPRIS
ncbi:MAG: hypothetical protein JNM43_07060 [Planctomycetaceae bacterium]|nr:hypothetical protein [Planctomycetaceae bacterium]